MSWKKNIEVKRPNISDFGTEELLKLMEAMKKKDQQQIQEIIREVVIKK